eukprot:261526_1
MYRKDLFTPEPINYTPVSISITDCMHNKESSLYIQHQVIIRSGLCLLCIQCQNQYTDSNLTQLPRQKFQDEISRLFDEYKSTESVGNIANKMNDCERCQFVIQRFLQPFTERLMPIHPNIKCYVEIEKEKELLNAISAITGVSTGSLKQYYKELAEYKIDERDLTIFHDSFQSNGKISYCSVSEIAYDICEWIGPCGEDIDTNAYVRL